MKAFFQFALLAVFCCFHSKMESKTAFFIEIDTIPPCDPPNAPPSEDCESACIYCNFINGFAGTTIGLVPSGVPNFCGSIENDQWFGFVAGATTATISVTPVPLSCQNGNGIQLALYADCGGPFLQCNTGCSGCGETLQSITVTTMVPGQSYLLLVDGWAGDQCDFKISVSPQNAANGPAIGATGPFSGPQTACPSGTETFCIDAVSGASGYFWTIPADAKINGQPGPGPIWLDAPAGRCAEIQFGSSGQKTICIRPENSCQVGSQLCQLVDIQPITPTVLPPVSLCPMEALTWKLPWGDSILPLPGTHFYGHTLKTATGCDSILTIAVHVDSQFVQQLLPQTICSGDTFFLNGLAFFENGFYQIPTSSGGQPCDSVVQFYLFVLNPLAQITGQTAFCEGSSTVLKAADNLAGGPPSIVWQTLAGMLLGTDNSLTVSELDTIILAVSQELGGVVCTKMDTVILTSLGPAPDLTANGGTIDCQQPTKNLLAQSTVPGSTFEWKNPAGNIFLNDLLTVSSVGTYSVVVTSPNGCTNSTTVEVTWGDLQNTFFLFDNPSIIDLPPASSQSVLVYGQITNLLIQPIKIKWTRTFLNLSPGCSAVVMDAEGSWGPSVVSNEFTVPSGSLVPLSVQINDGISTACCGIVHLKVQNTCTLRDSATFVYIVNCTVPTREPGAAPTRIFPNPSDDLFFIENPPETAVFIEILNLDGRLVFENELANGVNFSLKNEPAGTFFVVFRNEKREVVGLESVVLQR